ncbi:hypothetical protein DFQ26_005880 [Actinomortierella ambigua]|nr:hypothetical protein DFQ26_005880 [Actinomortierella ambigua]
MSAPEAPEAPAAPTAPAPTAPAAVPAAPAAPAATADMTSCRRHGPYRPDNISNPESNILWHTQG